MGILSKIFGDLNARVIRELEPIVLKINALEGKFEKLTNEELRGITADFRRRLAGGEKLDALLPEAFAACREAARRTLHQRHFDVQLLGGIALHRGAIAEMRTGEGKTLTATLPIYLNALSGAGVHVVTVNDYLSRRDSVWMGQIYHALGLSVGCINHESAYLYDPDYKNQELRVKNPRAETGSVRGKQELSGVHEDGNEDKQRDEVGSFKVENEFLRPVLRAEAYRADITYGTNNEYGFDYLRDNMASSREDKVQRELNYAIVDEVDSILIDEARTPLIISAPAEESSDIYYKFAGLVKRLCEGEDYNVDEKMRAVSITEAGIGKMERWLGVANLYAEGGGELPHHLEQALRANVLYKRDKEYVVREGEVVIVDEFTGRLMFGRRYSEGLHQAIEAKEGVKIQRESQTLATVTFQNYFRLYKKLAGMTGTAATEAEEFSKIYKLEVTQIPTNKPMIRADGDDLVYKNEAGKFKAVIAEIAKRHKLGQPVLVGTISIEKNEALSLALAREGIPHEVLNAKNHEREAQIIAQAGGKGKVTIATNMAGRGVDIILGGNPPSNEEAEEVKKLGGLHVIGTERHESRRIDNQLRGRAGRQGDPGSSQFFVSLDDDLMRIFAGERVRHMMERLGLPEDQPIQHGLVSRSLAAAQKKVEGHNFDIRKHLLEYDDVLNKHREVIYKKRNEVLETAKNKPEEMRGRVLEMVERELERVVLFHTGADDEKQWNLEEVYEVAGTIFPISAEARIKMEDIERSAGDKLADARARERIISYLATLAEAAYGTLEAKIEAVNKERGIMAAVGSAMILRAIDALWIEHLDAIEHLRTGIGLRGYGQKDPLVEYKREAFRLFNELIELIEKQVVYSIYKVGPAAEMVSPFARSGIRFQAPAKVMEKGRSVIPSENEKVPATSIEQNLGPKVGRNEPCPCGATKSDGHPIKFKHCHGKNL